MENILRSHEFLSGFQSSSLATEAYSLMIECLGSEGSEIIQAVVE